MFLSLLHCVIEFFLHRFVDTFVGYMYLRIIFKKNETSLGDLTKKNKKEISTDGIREWPRVVA